MTGWVSIPTISATANKKIKNIRRQRLNQRTDFKSMASGQKRKTVSSPPETPSERDREGPESKKVRSARSARKANERSKPSSLLTPPVRSIVDDIIEEEEAAEEASLASPEMAPPDLTIETMTALLYNKNFKRLLPAPNWTKWTQELVTTQNKFGTCVRPLIRWRRNSRITIEEPRPKL